MQTDWLSRTMQANKVSCSPAFPFSKQLAALRPRCPATDIKQFDIARHFPYNQSKFHHFHSGKVVNVMANESVKKELARTLKFVLFSASAGIIQVASFTLLNELLSLTYWVAYLISLVLSVLWNFTLNRKFTFKSANNVPVAMMKVAVYYVVFTPLSTWWTAALTEPSYGIMWNEYLVLILTMLVNFSTEFLYDRFVVFGKSIDTAVKK